MKKRALYLPFMLATFLLGSCQKSDETFDNMLYIDASSMTEETVLKGTPTSMTKTLNMAVAHPAEQDINITYVADPSLVKTFNKAYGKTAVALPDYCYELPEPNAVINKGGVKSQETPVNFKNLKYLHRDLMYVLPVRVETSDITMLTSANVYYYCFRFGSLINVVPNMKENYATVNWKNPEPLSDLTYVTMEALIYVNEFSNELNTIFGVEGELLLRIGDGGWPANQLQIAHRGSQNFQSANNCPYLFDTNTWYHVALTLDTETHECITYVNGSVFYSGQMTGISHVNFVNPSSGYVLQIGRSYNNVRWLNGYICECRIWNKIRTQDEIAANPYYVDENSDGLIGYWKMDDKSGTTFKDYSVNGNDAVANETLKWVDVSLPATE